MYQALYRKWRPRTFDDVVGQEHITETLKRQVAAGRPSHAYLFTGTRGTGKTTCAKILSRAVNCQRPVDGNPCNQCPACLGIENGSVLEVLELDAASNNSVEQVRAMQDEAVYSPASVPKRVYILDEVHMLTPPAFNALLKILEEPPEHLMFILATTELHKVPATVRSRCQQFSFKRIPPEKIAQRLLYVSGQEGIPLTQAGANLLARLAGGGMRDGLSLLDQCAGGGGQVDEQEILDTLGLAGNLETARLMDLIAGRDAAGALEALARLYENGREAGSVLEELSALARDLLLRRTAPKGCAALLTGGYDGKTMDALGERLDAPRLLQMLRLLQSVLMELPRSGNRRTDAELCLIRLCDERLDGSAAGLAARVARLEQQLQNAPAPAAPPASPAPASPASAAPPAPEDPAAPEVPWEEPAPQEKETFPEKPAPEENFWPAFAATLPGKVPPSVLPYLNRPEKVAGVWTDGVLTLWTEDKFICERLNKPAVLQPLAQAAGAFFGCSGAQAAVRMGAPPERPPAGDGKAGGKQDALDELLAFGSQFDNIKIR